MKHVCRICLKVISDLNYVALKTDEPSQNKMQLSFCVPQMVVDLVKDPVFCNSCSVNDVYEETGECKNTRESFVITPNTNTLLPDEDLANGQNLNTDTQRSLSVPIDSFNKIINANNVTSSKLSKQTSVDELDSLSDDALWNTLVQPPAYEKEVKNEYKDITIDEDFPFIKVEPSWSYKGSENTSVQPLAYEEEIKNEYKDITIDEDFPLPKIEPSWSYKGYENTSFEDAKSGDCTTDIENNRASVQTDAVIQDCFVKLTRLPNNISYNNVNKSYYKGDCNFHSAQKSHLKQPFVCNVCDYRSAVHTDLRRHLRIHTGEKPYSCDVCTFRCTQKSSLQRHLITHTGEKSFICNVCDYRFAHRTSLNDHLKIHTGEKPYSCDVCTFRCTQKSSLQRHLITHTGEKPFVCNVCNYRSAARSDLRKHVRMHTGEKPYSCDVCTFRCTQKNNLQQHLRIHADEKPFACNACDFRSAGQLELRRHLKIHTGEKPYSCDVCTFRSRHKCNLQRHRRIHAVERT